MKYTDQEVREITENILRYRDAEKTEHFRIDATTGELLKYEILIDDRMRNQLEHIAESVQNHSNYENKNNSVVNTPPKEPTND